jgi:protein O-GlcNAc transferase
MANRNEARDLQLAFSLHRSGKFADAAKLYQKIIKRNPKEANALHSLGIIEAAADNYTEAAQLMARSLHVEATNVHFIQNYATVLCQLGQFKAASDICLRGLQDDGRNGYLLYVAAGALLQQGRLTEALSTFDRLLAIEPNHVAALTERGSVYLSLKKYDAARADIEKAMALRPQYAEAHLNHGILQGQLERHDEAIGAFERALKLNPRSANAWLGLGNVYFALKRYNEAVSAYDRALALVPVSAEAWLGCGNVFFDRRQYKQALAAYNKAVALQPGLAEAWLGCGNVFVDLGRADEALATFEKALSLKPQSAKALTGRGNALSLLKRHEDAFVAYDRAFTLMPDLVGLEGDRLFARMQVCDWRDFETERDRLLQSVRAGRLASAPGPFLSIAASADDQLACARAWTQARYPAMAQPLWCDQRYEHEKIRIAYLSADFRRHPVAYLGAGLFEAHDRSRFEVLGISIGPNDGSDIRARLELGFDRFMDAATLGADEIARWIRAEEVDILIDLTGFTQNGRPQILAHRPAPLQVNYLGFSGTMGTEHIDYIIADSVLVPSARRAHFAEKVVTLPHSYMPHDDVGRAISDQQLARDAFCLPEASFVFCCFNNIYKFSPELFAARIRLLKAVDGSVLWLSNASAAVVANLRKAAASAGVDPERLVFARHLASPAEHLARHRLADLFLDTLPYNAHTTASDALWAGLPVLTQIGETFAGRVAASLLTTLGLPELITESADEFEQLAIVLAKQPARLKEIRQKLARHRLSEPLFNTVRHARNIERAYVAIQRRHQNRLAPEHIDILEHLRTVQVA